MNTLKTFGLVAALVASAAGGVWAQSVTITAAPANFLGDSSGSSAQVGTNGPGSSQKYLDVEGSGNGSRFEAFGVIDFANNFVYDANGNPETLLGVGPSLTLDLTDQAFGPTKPGTLDFFLSDSSAPLSSLKYDTASANGGIGTQLDTLYSLGTASYTSTSRTPPGTDDLFNLTLSSAAQSYFADQLNTGGTLRLVIAADDSTPGEVASFAGAGGGSTGGYPALSFTAYPVPEASTTVSLGLLFALGLGGLTLTRRRRA